MSKASVCFRGMALSLLLSVTASAQAQSGLRLTGDAQHETWLRWQTRIALASALSLIDDGVSAQITGGLLFGDYYWSGPPRLGVRAGGGFRTTGGLLLGQGSLALGFPGLATAPTVGLEWSRASIRAAANIASAQSWSVTPYIGIGYSAVALRGSWGFSADLGLAGSRPSGLRTQHDNAFGSQGLTDLLRELRMTPLLQIGASYAF